MQKQRSSFLSYQFRLRYKNLLCYAFLGKSRGTKELGYFGTTEFPVIPRLFRPTILLQ